MQAHLDTSLLHGTFCSSLRARRVWRVLGPVLAASASQFQEQDLQDHDFVFRLGSAPQNLRILLLSPSSLEHSTEQETATRLERFSPYAMSNPQSNGVGFLISERPPARENGRCNVDGILGLQALIAECLETAIPIIPIPDSVSFLSSIQEYMASLVVLPVLRPELSDAVALLARTTRSRYFKITDEDTNFLVELFPSLAAMSRAVRTQDGRQMLRDYFGDALGTEMIRYWEEDEH